MFKSAKGVSIIDQRLAAEMHKRQIETLVKAEGVANKVNRTFQEAANNWLEMMVSDHGISTKMFASHKIWQFAFLAVPKEVDARLRQLIDWSHSEQVKIYASVIPRRWFRKVSPQIAAMNLEDLQIPPVPSRDVVVPGQLGGRDMVGRVFNEPIAERTDRMSDEEWARVLSKVVFPPPDRTEVEVMIHTKDHDGISWQGRFERLSRRITDVDRLSQELIVGFSEGENLQQLKKRALPLVQGIQASAQRIVRTEGLRVAEQVQRRSWQGLGDMMVGAQILAVLDQNTRPEHAARNGTIYYRDPGQGQRSMAQLPMLPDEFNCRCWSTPVLAPPKELENDPEVAAAFRNASGAGIPDPAAYNEWFASADRDRRMMAVGSRRYRAAEDMLQGFREPEWSDFIDAEGKLLPISQIRDELPADRAARKFEVDAIIRSRGDQVRAIAARGFVLPDDTQPPAPPVIPPVVPPVVPPPATPPPVVQPPVVPPAVPPVVSQPTVVDPPPTPEPIPLKPKAKPPLAKTIKDAKKIAKDFDLADHADFAGLDVEVANDMLQSVADAVSDFPELRKNLKFIGSIQARNKHLAAVHLERVKASLTNSMGREPDKAVMDYAAKEIKKNIGRVPGNVYAYSTADPDAGGVSVNSKFGKDAKQMRANLVRDVELGWHPPGCDTVKSVIDHEMAHEIDKLLGLADRTRFTDPELAGIVGQYTREQIGQDLSLYAKTNPKEVIAEAWAEYKNNPQPREIATKIGKFIQSRKTAPQTTAAAPQATRHTVQLPKNPKRVTVDQATQALTQLGYSRAEMPQFDLATKKQIWTVVDPSGQVVRLDTDELTKIIYTASDDPDTRAIKERGSKR